MNKVGASLLIHQAGMSSHCLEPVVQICRSLLPRQGQSSIVGGTSWSLFLVWAILDNDDNKNKSNKLMRCRAYALFANNTRRVNKPAITSA